MYLRKKILKKFGKIGKYLMILERLKKYLVNVSWVVNWLTRLSSDSTNSLVNLAVMHSYGCKLKYMIDLNAYFSKRIRFLHQLGFPNRLYPLPVTRVICYLSANRYPGNFPELTG